MNQFGAYRSYIEQRLRAIATDVAKTLARIARLETMLSQVGGGQGASGSASSDYLGQTTTTITAQAGGTFGSGTVERYDTSVNPPTATGLTETAYNADTAIASGKWVVVGRPGNGLPIASPIQC